MTIDTGTTVYLVRGTDAGTGELIGWECAGPAMAHAKAAELRMAGCKDVVTSIKTDGDEEVRD